MTEGRQVVITGRGVLSPLGCDWESFASAVRAGVAASPSAAPFPGAMPDDPVPYHPLSDPEALDMSSAGRDSEPLAILATTAGREALTEAGIPLNGAPLDDVGLVMNIVFGPSTAVELFLERLCQGGPRTGRPSLFVDTLMSMPASRLGIALRLRGSTAVLAGSSPFELALDWVRTGREHTVVAGGGEYQSPKCLRHYRVLIARSGAERSLLAQGAAFAVLEAADHAEERGAKPLAAILGAGAASEPQEVALPWSADPEGRAFVCAMRTALNEAQVKPEAVHAVVLAAGDDTAEGGELAAVRAVFGGQAESLTLLRPKRLLGEALGASAGLSLMAALASMEGESAARPALVLVNAFEMGGAVTSLVLGAGSP